MEPAPELANAILFAVEDGRAPVHCSSLLPSLSRSKTLFQHKCDSCLPPKSYFFFLDIEYKTNIRNNAAIIAI